MNIKTAILRDIERIHDGDMDNWNRSTVLMLAASSGDEIMIENILKSLNDENRKPLDEKCEYVQRIIANLAAKDKNDFDLVAFELSKHNTSNSDIIEGAKKGKDVGKEKNGNK